LALSKVERCKVFLRDGFKCQDCGKPARFYNPITRFASDKVFCDLIVHHIDGDCSNNAYNNLITLCDECHKKAHGGWFRNKPVKKYFPKTMTEEVIKIAESIFSQSEYREHGYLHIAPKLIEKWAERNW
jgi:hypothetical protein